MFRQRACRAGPALALPICFRYPETDGGGVQTTCELLDQPRQTFSLDRCVPWVLANASAAGYFRTLYPPGESLLLARAEELTPRERLTLPTDETALLVAGRRSAAAYLPLAEALAEQADSADLLETLGGGLNYMREYFASDALEPALEAWVQYQLGPIPLGDRQDERYQAARLALLGGIGRDPAILGSARETVERYLSTPPNTPPSVDPTLPNTFVQLAASAGNRPLYEAYRQRSQAAVTPEERYRFLYALADFDDADLLGETFEYALTPRVRAQDTALLISQLLDNPTGRAIVWPLLARQWDRLAGSLGAFGGTGRIVEALGQFCSRESARSFEQFFERHPIPGAERTLEQSLDRIQRCAAVADDQADALEDALEDVRPGTVERAVNALEHQLPPRPPGRRSQGRGH